MESMILFLASCALICAGLVLFFGPFWLHEQYDVDPDNNWAADVSKAGLVIFGVGSIVIWPSMICALFFS
jgi:hypothetical protein